MAAADILKNPKVGIFQQRVDQSAQHLSRSRILAFQTTPAVEISNFLKSKMADGCHLEKWKNGVLMDIINSLLKTGYKKQI